MRILMVHQPIDGGVARHVVDLFEGLTASGHEVVLCGPALPSASLLTSTVPADAPHASLAMERSIAPGPDLRSLARFAQIVRAVRPDLIHAHSSKAGAVARIGRLLHPRVPVLYTPHGYAFAGFFEHETERRAYREAERVLALLASGVVAVCEAEARLAASVGSRRRIRVVHNGIGTPPNRPVDPRVQEIARRGPVICTLTQLRPGKGIETLIDALPAVLARHPRVQVVIAGDGPLRDSLLTQALERGVARAINFLGEHGDPIAVLRGADVFLLTSWAESFPYVILEAMAVGLPVVSSDVGGIPEAITNGESGLLVPARNAPATARALNELLDRDDLRARLGATAQRVVQGRFNREAMVDGMARVYEHVLSPRGAANVV
jgi:glycosyltransferase involved in cell wall biosynthesis